MIVFAASGTLTAARKEFDLMGILVISLVTALGGGTLRDILLDRNPIFWIGDPTYIWIVILGSIGTLLYVRNRRAPDAALLVADALGMALFAIIGTQLAEGLGRSGVIAVLMGTITGAAGGVARDVLCAEVPVLFRKSETLYATTAILGCATYLLLGLLGIDRAPAALTGLAVIVGLRLAAIFWGLKLPAFTVK